MSRIKTVLAIGAHPDDLELGCGATLAKLISQGVHVRALVLTKGTRGCSDRDNREAETREALDRLGVKDFVQHDLPDTQLPAFLNEVIHLICEQVQDLNPQRVYTMFREDRHQDHRAVHEASMVACRPVPQILGYETPSSQPAFTPSVWEPIDERFLVLKIAALMSHVSQAHRLYMQGDQVRAIARFHGYQINSGPCEAFVPYKLISTD